MKTVVNGASSLSYALASGSYQPFNLQYLRKAHPATFVRNALLVFPLRAHISI